MLAHTLAHALVATDSWVYLIVKLCVLVLAIGAWWFVASHPSSPVV